ncbi:hypothetical protein BDV95DRAFT_598659 [Massariosphaeria phaeospora]|uniref:Uncharacterized protein n=1 Tax=Massariosphaeria phaeospora TaxID=100035 RepID=A0A7C8I847_9PLEO|nr:hypothetical protein BDV95DRAFT_598659 [Massariosphaeria phaeospora]
MGKAFFTGWALWQQMTFVLACGIVVTVALGLVKLRYDHYRIAKYTKIEKGKKVQEPEMLEAQPIEPNNPRHKEDIPFGIRAIESGIEVDGVWISRSNTPVGSSRSSMTDFKLSRSHNNSQLELPQAIHPSHASSRAPSSFDLAVNAERLPTNDSRSSSPARLNPNDARGARGSHMSNSHVLRNSATLQALEGGEPGPSTPRYGNNNLQTSSANSRNSSRTSDESDYMNMADSRPYEPAYINPRQAPLTAPVDPRYDLDLLQSHRMSHVAETGQLTPRVRKPGNSGEWASVADNIRSPAEISTANGVDYFVPQQKAPSPPPAHAAELPAPSASTLTQDGHVLNQAKQAVPLLESYAPRARYLPEAYEPRGPLNQLSYDDLPYEVETAQNQRDNQILRKVNSGFEILRPGTFQPPSPEEELAQEKRQSKRLQKKRRSSAGSGSRTSHFVEQV